MQRLMEQKGQIVPQLLRELDALERHHLERQRRRLESLLAQLKALDPAARLLPGTVQLLKEGKITALSKLRPGQSVRLSDGEFAADARIEKIEKL